MLDSTRTPPDWLNRDMRDVKAAAARLRIPEFAFFHLAYRRWFAEAASDPVIERPFIEYLYGRRVPAWVRHLARQVLACERAGAALSAEFGVRPVLPPAGPARAPAQQLCGILLAAFYAACFVLFTYHAL